MAQRAGERSPSSGGTLLVETRIRQRVLGVFGTGTGWPDVTVAAIMAGLALQGAATVMRQSLAELRPPLPIEAR